MTSAILIAKTRMTMDPTLLDRIYLTFTIDQTRPSQSEKPIPHHRLV